MSKFPKVLALAALCASGVTAPALAEKMGLGRPATPAEVTAWDLDVRPDGLGLPAGSGSVEDGEILFSDNCAVCHGEFAEGAGNWPKLAGGDDTLADDDPVKTVGSYWPHLSTAWDYVNRSMPFGGAQSLTADETYAIVAYILYSNFLVEDDFVLTRENFLDVEMPNADGFIVDDRPETEYPIFSGEACMTDCKDTVEITMRARVLDVTPQEEASTDAAASDAAVVELAAAPAAAPVVAELDPELVAAGEKVFKRCAACHQVGESAKNRVGPILNGIVDAPAGAVADFRYSKVLTEKAGEGLVWDAANLKAFLAKPKEFLPRTKMSFPGLRKEADLDAIVAYLQSNS